MKTIVSFIYSKFKPIGSYKKKKVPTGEYKRSLFGQSEIYESQEVFVQTGWSDTEIDLNQLSFELQEEISRLDKEGYRVNSILPVLSGRYQFKKGMMGPSGGYGYGYGYSYTEGFMLVASKTDNI